MLKSILKFLTLPAFVLIVVLGMTANDLKFATSTLKPLTAEDMANINAISYTQLFQLNGKMRYRVDIQSQDGSKTATLLWPKEPFQKILVLASPPADSLSTLEHFEGRLVRCVYRCAPSDMVIYMDDFIALIQDKFPDMKEQSHLMPTMVLDTTVRPDGFDAYFKRHRWHYAAVGASFLAALVLGVMFGNKKKKR